MATDGATTFPSPTDELARLRQEVETLRAALEQSAREMELRDAERQQHLEQQKQNARLMEQMQHQLQQLLRRLYGRSSEKIDPKQMLLFAELLEKLAPQTEPPAEDNTAGDAGSQTDNATDDQPRTRRKGHGRRRLPAHLPRETIIHDLPEDQKPCPICDRMRGVIGRQESEQLEYVPAHFKVIKHVQLTYGCQPCDCEAAETGAQIVTAAKPLSPIEKGLAAPGLLAYVAVSKYGDHLPLHRLEKIMERNGIQIARSTMCGWMAQVALVLAGLYDRMVYYLRMSKVIHTDDTPVDVLEPGQCATHTGRFWVYLGDPQHPYTVFDYTASRSRDGPMQFLQDWGKQESVYLQADAFGGYDGIYAGQAGGSVIEAACWAHARRKFYEAQVSDAAGSAKALAYIRLLYDVEDLAKERFAQQDAAAVGRTLPEIRLALRQEMAVPRLAEFKTWLQSQQAERGGPVLPKSPMGQAIGYALNQWDALCVYTTDGDLAIDNNAAENALRRIALGRKNWLFCGSDNGGRTAAVLFSLIATCQRHKVEPLAYLRDVLTQIATTPHDQLDQLLPDRWQPLDAAAAPVA